MKTNTANQSDEFRVTGEWEPEVMLKRNGKAHRLLGRKVVIKGFRQIDATAVIRDAISLLRHGYEVRLTAEGMGECLRLFPISSPDAKSMHVVSNAMKPLTQSISDLKIHATHDGTELDKEDVENLVDQAKQRNEEYRRNCICVTPDTMVLCPKCGTDLRIGKILKSN
mgnify:CR=1 FL=1